MHGLEDFFSMLQEIGRHIVMGHVLTAGGFAKRIEFLDLKAGQFDSEKTKKILIDFQNSPCNLQEFRM